MGIGSWILASTYDRLLEPAEEACLRAWRGALIAELEGAVLEVGAGTGANLGHYPPAVSRLVVSEPDANMRGRLDAKTAGSGKAAEIRSDGADRLDFPDATFDGAVATLVLCSVPDPARALSEIRRVLKPGGRYVFLEHVAAENKPDRLRWQRRVEPVWKRLMGNCHLTRRTEELILDAGFTIDRIERASMRKAMPLVRPTIRGVARA